MTRWRHPALARYLVVGGALFLIDFGLFMLLVRVAGVDLRLAQGISRTTGATLGFFGHRYFSFLATGDRAVNTWFGQGVWYVIAALILNLVASPFVVWGAFLLLGGRLVAAKIASDGVLILFSYALLRFVFRTRDNMSRETLSAARVGQ